MHLPFRNESTTLRAMKFGVVALGTVGLLGLSSAAFAQETPRARTGFQMDIRTGYSIPMGKIIKDHIEETALHEWLTLGVRFVFFP
jgi:hypothetical protein